MEEWKEYKISNICNIKHGFAFKGQYFTDTKQIHICTTPGNFALKGGFKLDKPKYYNGPIPIDYILRPDDLIVTMTDLSKEGDTLGYSALVPQNQNHIFLHNQRIGLVENIQDEIDKHFLYWIMRTYKYQKYIVNHSSGSTVKHTSPNSIGTYTFKAPSLKKQKEIASFLDNIETKIGLNRKINDNLEQQAQALFKSWFVDFEPFKDGKFVESELGMIPKGWRVGTLNEIGNVVGGGTPSKSKPEYYCSDGIAWITPKDLSISKTKFISNGEIDITELGYKNSSAKIMPKGSILFSSRAPIGYIAIALNDITTNQGFKSVIPKKAGTAFIYLYLKDSVDSIESQATGSTFKEASGALMKTQKVLIPSGHIYDDFENLLRPIFKKQADSEIECRNLSTIRDTLLPKLMSGKLKINDLTR